jgi:hypothetical protein
MGGSDHTDTQEGRRRAYKGLPGDIRPDQYESRDKGRSHGKDSNAVNRKKRTDNVDAASPL